MIFVSLFRSRFFESFSSWAESKLRSASELGSSNNQTLLAQLSKFETGHQIAARHVIDFEGVSATMNNANENSSLKGVVKWFNDAKGFGFIQHSSGKDVFVHYSVISQEGFKTLKDGEEVEYELKEGPKGLQATKVNRSASALAAQVEQMTVASAATASAVSQITAISEMTTGASASMASGAMGSASMSGGMEAPKGMVTQLNK